MSQAPTPTPPPVFRDDDSESDAAESGRADTNVRQTSEVPKTPNRALSRSTTVTPKTGSRRATPRSRSRNSTPGRGSVRRTPSTPYTLRAMQEVAAVTPTRTVVRETRRYTPGSDLRLLSRLLVRERHGRPAAAQQEAPATLKPPALIISQQEDVSYSRLSEQHQTTTLSELDQDARRVSERLSGRFSLPSNNVPSDLFNDLAVPEAVVDDPALSSNVYEDPANIFGAGGGISSDDDLDGAENHLIYTDDEFEFSLLKDRSGPVEKFKPMASGVLTTRKTGDTKLPLSFLRRLSRATLADLVDVGVVRQRQFSATTLAALQDISDEFLTQQMADLTGYAKHANRKMISSDDIALLMRRHKDAEADHFKPVQAQAAAKLTKNTELFCLAQQFCNLSELREIESNLYKNEKRRSKKRRKVTD